MSNFIQDNSFDCGHDRQVIKVSAVEEELNSLKKENVELKGIISNIEPIIENIYSQDYGSQISDDLFLVLQYLKEEKR